MLHGFNFLKLVFLSNSCDSHILQYQGPVFFVVRRTSNQTDWDVTFPDRAINGKSQKKDWKIIIDV